MKHTKTIASAVLSACALTVTAANADIATGYATVNAALGSGTLDFGSYISATNYGAPAPLVTAATVSFHLEMQITPSMLVSTSGFTPYEYVGYDSPQNHSALLPPDPTLSPYRRPDGTPWPYYGFVYRRLATEDYFNSTQVEAAASVGSATTAASNSLLSTPQQIGGVQSSGYWVFGYHVVTDPNAPPGLRNSGPLPNYAIDYDVFTYYASNVKKELNGYSDFIDISVPLDSAALDIFNNSGTVTYSLLTSGGNFLVSYASLNYSYEYTPTAVPEADTWAMLLAGLGLVGLMVRRRRQAEA